MSYSISLQIINKCAIIFYQKNMSKQFSHPISEKLLKLLNCTGEPLWWGTKASHPKSERGITICQVYWKPSSRPVVGLPLVSSFEKRVAMDLQFYHNKILLHFVDHATRISAKTVIPPSEPDTIIKPTFSCLIQMWVSREGPFWQQ